MPGDAHQGEVDYARVTFPACLSLVLPGAAVIGGQPLADERIQVHGFVAVAQVETLDQGHERRGVLIDESAPASVGVVADERAEVAIGESSQGVRQPGAGARPWVRSLASSSSTGKTRASPSKERTDKAHGTLPGSRGVKP